RCRRYANVRARSATHRRGDGYQHEADAQVLLEVPAYDLLRNEVAGRVRSPYRTPRGRTRILCAHVVPEGIRGSRLESRSRAVESLLQSAKGNAARHALPGGALAGGETRALHPGQPVRRC